MSYILIPLPFFFVSLLSVSLFVSPSVLCFLCSCALVILVWNGNSHILDGGSFVFKTLARNFRCEVPTGILLIVETCQRLILEMCSSQRETGASEKSPVILIQQRLKSFSVLQSTSLAPHWLCCILFALQLSLSVYTLSFQRRTQLLLSNMQPRLAHVIMRRSGHGKVVIVQVRPV